MKELLKNINHSDPSSFQKIAEQLMNHYKLQVRDKFYRIIECEFYYHNKDHEDPYVHGHELQKQTIGEWYFHGSGLDITLFDGEAFGGILIRGIAEIKDSKQPPKKEDAIIGPLNVCTAIFKQIGNVMSEEPIKFGFIDLTDKPEQERIVEAKVFATSRIGLNETKNNGTDFNDRHYRFITFLHLGHREYEKIKKILSRDNNVGLEEFKLYYAGKKY